MKVICFATGDWDAVLWTNKQQLMSRLAAREVDVLYVDSPGHRTPGLNGRDARRVLRRLRVWRPTARRVADHLHRDSPLLVPLHGRRGVGALNHRLLRWRLARNDRLLDLRGAVLWAYTPTALDVYEPGRHAGLVYHCVDFVGRFPGVDAVDWERGERALVEAADVCIGSSKPLVEHVRKLGARRVEYWPNPADTLAIEQGSAGRSARSSIRVGFVGAIQDDKIDIELLRRLAEALPAYEFVLAGPLGEGLATRGFSPELLPSNIELVGSVARSDLPGFLADLDVGIVPYRLTPYTEGVFPLKVFEYLAAGLPVVSTRLPSIVGEVEFVRFADAESFATSVVEAATEGRALADARRRYARDHSWDARVDEVVGLLEHLPSTRLRAVP